MSSFGKSAVMKALTVTDTSSGSWVSDSAVCTTWEQVQGNRRLEKQKAPVMNEMKRASSFVYLVNEWSSEGVALEQHASPQLGVFATDQIARKALEQGVLIADLMSKKKI